MKNTPFWILRLSFLVGLAVLLAGCSPRFQGSYRGAVRNTSYDVMADLYINLEQHGDIVSGSMTIGPPLGGGGAISGKVDGKQIVFITSDSEGGRISWFGEINGKIINGEYIVEPHALNAVINGVQKQQGVWSVTR